MTRPHVYTHTPRLLAARCLLQYRYPTCPTPRVYPIDIDQHWMTVKVKPSYACSLPSVGPGTDPGVQAVSPQVTMSHPPGGRLLLLSTRPAVTFPAAERHRP